MSDHGTDSNSLWLQGWSDAEEAVGWAIMQGLHSHLPEDRRPSSWMDFNSEQLPRIRAAAQAAMAAYEKIRAT